MIISWDKKHTALFQIKNWEVFFQHVHTNICTIIRKYVTRGHNVVLIGLKNSTMKFLTDHSSQRKKALEQNPSKHTTENPTSIPEGKNIAPAAL